MGLMCRRTLNVNVVENTDNTVHITMPMAPASAADLSDEELSNAAGGFTYSTHANIANVGGLHCLKDDPC